MAHTHAEYLIAEYAKKHDDALEKYLKAKIKARQHANLKVYSEV